MPFGKDLLSGELLKHNQSNLRALVSYITLILFIDCILVINSEHVCSEVIVDNSFGRDFAIFFHKTTGF